MKKWGNYTMSIPGDHYDAIDDAVLQRIENIKLYDPAGASSMMASWVRMKADFLRGALEEQANERTT